MRRSAEAGADELKPLSLGSPVRALRRFNPFVVSTLHMKHSVVIFLAIVDVKARGAEHNPPSRGPRSALGMWGRVLSLRPAVFAWRRAGAPVGRACSGELKAGESLELESGDLLVASRSLRCIGPREGVRHKTREQAPCTFEDASGCGACAPRVWAAAEGVAAMRGRAVLCRASGAHSV